MKRYIFESTFWDKFLCFFLGHQPYRRSYKNVMEINRKRKGGKRKGRGITKYKTNHYREFCTRCGLLIRRK